MHVRTFTTDIMVPILSMAYLDESVVFRSTVGPSMGGDFLSVAACVAGDGDNWAGVWQRLRHVCTDLTFENGNLRVEPSLAVARQ